MFDKLSSYNLITNLIPGAVLAVALRYSGLPIVGPENIGTFAVLAYALGALSSRTGSLLIDPMLKKSGFLPPRDYRAFVEASAKDPKMDILVETANGYRTFLSAGVLYFVLMAGNSAARAAHLNQVEVLIVAAVTLTVIFAFSYKKQDSYVSARVARLRPKA